MQLAHNAREAGRALLRPPLCRLSANVKKKKKGQGPDCADLGAKKKKISCKRINKTNQKNLKKDYCLRSKTRPKHING